MTITLTPSQISWLEAEVAAGHFGTVDEAAQAIINEHMVRDLGDLEWAKPLLDEARAKIARGECSTLDEFNTHVKQMIAKLER
jgi:Arc/MetJ-type ribon-helix-helix transcriptional regulator